MTAGSPGAIFASDLSVVREVLEPGTEALLAPMNDASTRAARIDDTANDPELAGRLGRTARTRLLGQLTWQRRAERIDSALAAA